MALDQKFFKKSTAATGLADQEEGLVLHLDANDVDSYDGDGSIWYDINGHEVNIPLASDDNNNLKIHYDPSNTNSYSGTGTTLTNLAGNSLNATVVASRFDNDYTSGLKGYFDISTQSEATISIPSGHPLNGDFTLEFWFRWQGTPGSGGHRFINESTDNLGFFYYKNYGWRFYESGSAHSGYYGGSSGSIQANVWQHKVITFSGTAFKGYLDGNQIHSTTYTRPGSSLGSFNFGTTNIAGDKPDCDIGAIRMYNRALTAAEVGQNFRAGNNFSYSSIITSKHAATQGALHTSNLQIDLDANSYSGSGNWLDGANDYDATISAATYVNDNNSDYFDFAGSTNNPVSISYNSILNAAARTWEFWVWFDTDAMNFFGGVWGSANNTKTVLFRMKDSNNAIRAQVYDGAGTSVEPTTANNVVNINEWNHIVFTSNNSDNSFKIYVNGVEKYSDTLSIDMNTSSTDNFIIGAGGGYSSNRLNGRVAQFRYYNAVLTSAQVNTNYNATKALYQNPNVLTDLRPSDYSSGTTWSDSSTKSNNATLNNFSSTVADYYDQEIGDFFDLDGSNDYFSTSITKNWASIPFSVEMWFNTDSRNGEYLWGLNDTAGNGVAASTRGSGNSYQLMFLGSGVIVSAGVVQTNRWYHLVFTSDGTTKKAYLDGSFVASGTTTINSAANGKAFIFGRYGTYAGAYFNGKIGHTRVYEGALTAEEVAQNYLATKNKYPNGNNLTLYSPDFKNTSTPYYFRFNAANDEARLSSVDIDVSMGFTVSVYIRRHTSVSGYQQPFRITGTGYTTYLFMIAGLNDTVYYSSSGTGNSLSTYGSSGNWTDNSGAWRNVIFTRENTPGSTTNRGEIYVNGASHHEQTNLSAITNITNVYVNRDASYPTSRNSQCDIGLIKIWQRPFSDAEALAEYNATKDIYGL